MALGLCSQSLAAPDSVSSPRLAAKIVAPGAGKTVERQPPAVSDQAASGGDRSVRPVTRVLTLSNMGAETAVQLRGVNGYAGLNFGVRADEVVTSATLLLKYTYSPALLPDISQLNVLVNGETVDSIPLLRERAGGEQVREIEIPTRLLSDYTQLTLQFFGHYTRTCEDPFHSSLWLNVSRDSTLTLSSVRLRQPDDLALLPEPFFDRRDSTRLQVPFVFGSPPDRGTLEAAAAAASWLGFLAGYRGARFDYLQDELPRSGNGVVFAVGKVRWLPTLPEPDGPIVAMVANPNDSSAKLLVFMGRDAAEVKTAVHAVAFGWDGLVGPLARIAGFRLPERRKAYDAPAWLPSNRPVSFRDLASYGSLVAGGLNLSDPTSITKALSVSGYSPDLIRINLRLPPDLFSLQGKGIPVDLRYRYTPRPEADKSNLNVNNNYEFLESYPLEPSRARDTGWWNRFDPILADGDRPAARKFHIPLYRASSRSQLQFHFFFDAQRQRECSGPQLDNVRAGVEPDSTLDLSGIPHFIEMPDLAAFANSGFPFTKYADLAETSVILPDQPTPAEYAAFFRIMGRLGDATGYPASRVVVAPVSDIARHADRELLLIGAAQSLTVLDSWREKLPWAFSESGRKLRFDRAHNSAYSLPTSAGGIDVQVASEGPVSFLAGFESPLMNGRSVVVLSASESAALDPATTAMMDPKHLRFVQGSLVIFRGDQATTINEEKSYHVGDLPYFDYIRWYLSRRPLWLVIALLIAVPVIASLLYAFLKARVKHRLET